MKKLKHLKIFEAFQSNKLSKVLGYISKDSRKASIDVIKRIFNEYDFPESEISDEYIEYLPFKKALMKSSDIISTKCTSTSKEQFGRSHGIEGEVCTDGKIKRKWGTQIRSVVCNSCKGMGNIMDTKSDIKLLKIWFSIEGKYITTTCVDGIIRERDLFNNNTIKLSENPNDYVVVVNNVYYRDIVPNNYYSVRINESQTYVYIIREGNTLFAIQNHHSGSTPYSTGYKNIASYSWQLDSSNVSNIILLKKKEVSEVEEVEEEINPYTWNTSAYIGRRIESRSMDIKNSINDANFALIIDVNKLKLSEYTKKYDIKKKRGENIKGALALRNNDDIKSENIDRYINELSDRIKIEDTNILSIKKVINKLIVNNNLFYELIEGDTINTLYRIIGYYSELLKYDGDNIERFMVNMSDNIKGNYSRNFKNNNQITKNLSFILNQLKKDEKHEEYKFILNTIEVSKLLKNLIINADIETIYDMEILYGKLYTISNALSSSRYGKFGRLSYISYMRRENPRTPLSELYSRYNGFESKMLDEIEEFKTLIKRI